MKRILYTTLLAVLATLTPAFAGGTDESQIVKMESTKYGSMQNAEGTAKITFGEGDVKPGPTVGLVMTASVPDETQYLVVLVTNDGAYKVGRISTYLGSGSIKLTLSELPSDIVSMTDIVGVSLVYDGEIVLMGNFYSIQPSGLTK